MKLILILAALTYLVMGSLAAALICGPLGYAIAATCFAAAAVLAAETRKH